MLQRVDRARMPLRRRILRIRHRHRRQQERRVAYRARHRTGGVLRMGDRNDAVTAHQADGRLDADDAVDPGRTDDRAVGLGTYREYRESGRYRDGRAARRAARTAIEHVWISHLAADTAPATARVGGAEVRPLAQVRFAQNHRTGLPQSPPTWNASSGARRPANARDPAVVAIWSPVSMFALSTTGMPWSGPRGPLSCRSRSSAAAIASASGLISMIERSRGPARSISAMRPSWWATSARGGQLSGFHPDLELADVEVGKLLHLCRQPRGRAFGCRRTGPQEGSKHQARHTATH